MKLPIVALTASILVAEGEAVTNGEASTLHKVNSQHPESLAQAKSKTKAQAKAKSGSKSHSKSKSKTKVKGKEESDADCTAEGGCPGGALAQVECEGKDCQAVPHGLAQKTAKTGLSQVKSKAKLTTKSKVHAQTKVKTDAKSKAQRQPRTKA
jgi:hypothetical protein